MEGEQKLTLKISDHHTSLQKHLHQQWMQGQNCDLAFSAGSCRLPVHSCVVSCFSAKISHHLLKAKTHSTLNLYSVNEDGVFYCFLETGEKKVVVDVEEDLLRVLVGYMYTGSLSVAYCQVAALLTAAELLGLEFVANIIEMFIKRNPGMLDSQYALSGQDIAHDETSQLHEAESRQHASNTKGHGYGSLSGEDQFQHIGQACTSAALPGVNKDCVHGTLDISGLNVKQEIIDPDLQELLEFSAQVEGKEYVPPASHDSSLPDLKREVQTEKGDNEDSVERGDTDSKTVMIKQEVIEDVLDTESSEIVADKRGHDQGGVGDSELDHAVDFPSADVENETDAQADNDSSDQDKTSKECEVSTGVEGAGTFACAVCGKSFGNKNCVKRHMIRTHKRKKFLQKICPHCDKHFEEKEELTTHCRDIHKSLVCDVKGCVYWTSQSSRMTSHQTRVHNKCYPCSKCDFRAPDKETLKTHDVDKHRVTYLCSVCHQTFLFKKNLTQHQRAVHRNKRGKKQPQKCSQSVKANSVTNDNADSESVQSITEGLQHQQNAQSVDIEKLEVHGIEAVLAAVNSELCLKMNGSQDVESEQAVSSVSTIPQDSYHIMVQTSMSAESSRKKQQTSRRTLRKRRQCCKFCGRKEQSKEVLSQHLRKEHWEKCFPCQQCPEAFIRKEGLTLHVRNWHASSSWTCSHCGEVFNIAAQFSAHCRTKHNNQKPFHCRESPTCRFRASKLSYLEFHKQHVHVKERSAVCHKCRNCFPSKEYLRLHHRSCLRLEQHLCSTCGKVFTLRQSLLNHIDIKHGGQRRFGCTHCGRRFSCHANRNRHMRIHNNTFPYMCDICGQKFRHSNSFKDHTQRKHGKQTMSVTL